ncbi:DUF4388 domain-containing protein [bacterium]|nr:DUF4388 domain-containing protein [bacterium]
MQGNLKQIQLPEVLQFISMGKSTGLLTVKDGAGLETTLMIKSGRIINSSALERQRRLGDLLVHRGILKRSVLAQVLALQRTVESDKRLGQILVERDIIQEAQIREVLRLQLEEEIWNLFGIEEGEFRFEQVPDDKLGEASVQIDIEPLLLEGTRRQDEWRRIVRVLPSDRLVPAVKAPAGDGASKMKLDPREWKVLAQINGKFPIRAVVNRAAMGRFEVYQIITVLMQRGVVYILDEKLSQNGAAAEATSKPAVAAPSAAKPAGGVTGLFSIFSSGKSKEDKNERVSCVSPIGVAAWMANKLLDSYLSARELKPQPGDGALLPPMWKDLLISYPRADIISIENNHVSAERMETYIKLFEFGEATQDSYEDCLEALLQLTNGLYRVFSQRIGEKNAARIAREVLDEAARVPHQFAPEVKIADRAQSILRLQA